MADDTVEPFLFPPTSRKKVTAAFDGGRIPPLAASCYWRLPSGVSGWSTVSPG